MKLSLALHTLSNKIDIIIIDREIGVELEALEFSNYRVSKNAPMLLESLETWGRFLGQPVKDWINFEF